MLDFPKRDVTQFFRTFSIETFTVSPDETQLVFSTNFGGAYNLWALDTDRRFPYPLTFIDQSNHGLEFDKSGRFIVAAFDTDGDENGQIYALLPEGGALKPLRIKEGERHFIRTLSEDGKRLYYTSTKNNPTYLNSYVYNLETEAEETLLEGEQAPTMLLTTSPDESSFLFSRTFVNTHSCVYICKNGNSTPITPHTENPHTVSDVVYTSENDVYFTTNYGEDFSYLAHYDVENDTFTKIVAMESESFASVQHDKNRNVLYLTASAGVTDKLYRYDMNSKALDAVSVPVDVIEQLRVTERGSVYLLGSSATLPTNIFRLTAESDEWDQLTDLKVPGVPREAMGEPQTITYRSFDGMEIEALYFKARPEVDNKHLILWPHGGPQSSERKWFRALFQFLVYEGYNLLMPNFRGSTDYGLSFMQMVEGDWGHGPRLDNVKALDYMIDNGYVDRDKILLMGGSYGGYMALLLHGRHANYFKAVVDIFGVSNLFTIVESVPDFWKPRMIRWIGDPVKDRDLFIADSPITYLDQMTKPMLVIQGANDPRVVKAESDQIVDALREKGVNVEYLVLDDEGHGFSKKENEIEVYQRILAFFNRMIGK